MDHAHGMTDLETTAHLRERRAMRDCLLLLLAALLAVAVAVVLPSPDDGRDADDTTPARQTMSDPHLGGNYFGAQFAGSGSDAEP